MRYSVGDIVEGVVTGIKPYGAFVSLDSSHNGLIHISEISERYVRDVHTFVSINQRVRVKILDQDDDGVHFRLSLKAVNAGKKRFARRRHQMQAYPPQQIGVQLACGQAGRVDRGSIQQEERLMRVLLTIRYFRPLLS